MKMCISFEKALGGKQAKQYVPHKAQLYYKMRHLPLEMKRTGVQKDIYFVDLRFLTISEFV